MKTIFMIVLLSASSLFAEVKPIGEFIPHMCSSSSKEVVVCTGVLAGIADGKQYYSIYKQNQTEVYQVVAKRPANGGFNPAMKATEVFLRSATGKKAVAIVRSSNGVISSFEKMTRAGLEFSVGGFQWVAVTQ